jgi:toluene monooxygenase system ferredoxin subunit
MAFQALCHISKIAEGQVALVRLERRSVLLVWPSGGTLQAYRGRCPHQDVPLISACFDGTAVTCDAHEWCFDGRTGACLTSGGRELKRYAVRVDGDKVHVDLS